MNFDNPVHVQSPAKINWLLHVGGIRPDGFHELVTIFQELELSESMVFRALPDQICQLSGFPDDIPAHNNLVTKAWQLMRATFPIKILGLDVRIVKQLPQGGGLAGGSSNGAATLKALNRLYNLEASPETLERLAGELGSDVPFFIKGGLALGKGRGEILEPLPACPTYHLVLVIPKERMSTAEGFRLLDTVQRVSPSPHTLFHFLTELHSGEINRLAQVVKNDFEEVAQMFPWYIKAHNELLQAGAVKVLLCGSGSTVAGLAGSQEEAQRIARKVGGIATRTAGL